MRGAIQRRAAEKRGVPHYNIADAGVASDHDSDDNLGNSENIESAYEHLANWSDGKQEELMIDSGASLHLYDINKLTAYVILNEDNFPKEALARAKVLLDDNAAQGKRAISISSEEEGGVEPPPPKKIMKVTNPGEGKAKTEKDKAKTEKEQWSSNGSGLAARAMAELETAIRDGTVDSQALLKFTATMNEAEKWWARIRKVNEKSTAGNTAKKRAGVLLGAWNPSPRPQPCPLLHSCLLPYPSSSGDTGTGEEVLALGHGWD